MDFHSLRGKIIKDRGCENLTALKDFWTYYSQTLFLKNKHIMNTVCFWLPSACAVSQGLSEVLALNIKHTLFSLGNLCCPKHFGSDWRLLCVENCSAFIVHKEVPPPAEAWWHNSVKRTLLMFSCPPCLSMHMWNNDLNCIMSECLILNVAI